MLFYRLFICRLMAFLGLDELYKEKEQRDIMLGKKKKPFHKPKLLMNENMQTITFMILAGINMLFMLTLPLAILEEPCEVFKKFNMLNFYAFTVTVKKYATLIDRIIILMFVALVIVGVKTVLDAIAITKINLSPWLEQGKYALPGSKCCDHKVRDPAKERAEARARAKYYDKISEEIYKQYEESNGRFFDREFYQMYYGTRHNHYDLIFNDKSSLNSNRTSRQTSNRTSDQANDQANDQTFHVKHDETYDQTFELADDQTYDQNIAQSFDQANDQTFDVKHDETYDQTFELADDQTYDQNIAQSFDQANDQTFDVKHDETYDQTFELADDQTYDQNIAQSFDQANDQTFDVKHDETYDQTFELADDQTYDQNIAQSFDRTYDQKFELAYPEYLDQARYETPEQTSDEISDQSSELSSGEISETNSDN